MAKLTAVFDMKERITRKIRTVSNRLQNLNRVRSTPTIEARDRATRQINNVSNRMSILDRLRASPIMRIRDLATRTFEQVRTKLVSFARSSYTATLAVHDKVSSVIGRIKEKVFSLKGLAVTIGAGLVTGAVGQATIGQAMTLENQQVAMDHFMRVGNTNFTPEQVQNASAEYLDWLRNNANFTPFQTSEVIAAGTRALIATQGNSTDAQQMVLLAEDMAASSGGTRTVQDAMEALAAARMRNEFSMLDAYGINMNVEKFNEVGWEGLMKEGFDLLGGAAEAFSKTSAGYWSTITGSLGTSFQNMGIGALDQLRPMLAEVADYFSGGGLDTFTNMGSRTLESLFKTVVNMATGMAPHFERLYEWFSSPQGTQAIDSIIEKAEQFGTTVGSKLVDGIMYVADNWDDITDKIVSGGKFIGEVLVNIGTYVGKFIDWWQGLGSASKNTVGILAAIGIGLKVLAPVFMALFFAGKSLWGIFKVGSKVLGTLGKVFMTLGRWIRPIIPWFLNLIKIGVRFIPVIGWIITAATLLWYAFKNWDKIREIAAKVFGYLETNIPIWIDNAKQWAIEKLIEMAIGFALWFEDMRQTVSEKLESAKEKVIAFFSPLFEFIDSSKTKFNEFRTKLSDVADTVKSKLETAKESVTEFFSPLLGFLDSAKTKWDDFKNAVSNFSMPKIGIPKLLGGNGVVQFHGSHRSGLNRVPFDGYIAELHKDEAVLPRQEAEIYRKNSTGESFVKAIGTSNNSSGSILNRVTSSLGNNKMTGEVKVVIEKLIEKAEITNEADEDRLVKNILKAIEQLLNDEYDVTGDGQYE